MSAKNCVTHSHACDCREEKFKELIKAAKQIIAKADASYDSYGDVIKSETIDNLKKIIKDLE